MPKLTHVFYTISLAGIVASCQNPEPKTPVQETKTIQNTHFVLPKIPDTVDFAGKAYVLEGFDAKERLDRELLVNTYFHSSTIIYFKRANRYFGQLERILKEENVDPDFKYLCVIESGLSQAVSPSGAKGFWQFMPETAMQYGMTVNKEIDERLNIEKSTRAACAYLKNAQSKFNDWALTAAAYNRGMGGISSDLEFQSVDSYFDLHLNSETARYFFRILALKLIFENPEAYGFHPDEMYLYEPIKTRSVKVNSTIENLADWAQEHGSNYHELKELNPWIIGNRLTIRNESYVIELSEK